jgi:hypothetical protein
MQFMGHGKNVTDGFAKPVRLSKTCRLVKR